jgi:hypothetical protein
MVAPARGISQPHVPRAGSQCELNTLCLNDTNRDRAALTVRQTVKISRHARLTHVLPFEAAEIGQIIQINAEGIELGGNTCVLLRGQQSFGDFKQM